jgi:hypothetical protein
MSHILAIFEQNYPASYQSKQGFWGSVIRKAFYHSRQAFDDRDNSASGPQTMGIHDTKTVKVFIDYLSTWL